MFALFLHTRPPRIYLPRRSIIVSFVSIGKLATTIDTHNMFRLETKKNSILTEHYPNCLRIFFSRISFFFSSKNAPLYPPPVHFSGQFFPFHYPYERYFILDSRTIQEFSLPFRGTSTFIRCQIKFARAFLT